MQVRIILLAQAKLVLERSPAAQLAAVRRPCSLEEQTIGDGKQMDATPEMPASSLIELLCILEESSVQVWLDGGWGVDALLGHQTRKHMDVDMILRVADVVRARRILANRGFTYKEGSLPTSFVLADSAGLEVDVHAVVFDEEGNGIYRMQNGEDWIYPAEGFMGSGMVDGVAVRCLSPAIQVLCHAHGYEPTEKDFRDMELLQKRFGVELPPQLKRDNRDSGDADVLTT
ncbi:MAG: nucleotidyltransferase domain-containing protein [Anaerolineales bacterium]